jgi:glutaconyl-CoA/methylmalonyl-CoA decarboxylase subunit gamma
MRITLDVDGRPRVIEVDLDAGTVRVGEKTYPAKVVADSPTRVELEIGGEKVTVEGWRPGESAPAEAISVDGERFVVRATVEASGPRSASAPKHPVPPAPAPVAPAKSEGDGRAIAPPMPGKVVEVRVREGETVRAGQVLLVLEAMKMRNEVAAPVGGVVRSLRVSAGSNVRAREPMLQIAPE